MKNYIQLDDSMLWTMMQEGDEHALETIYRKYYGSLFNYGKRICLNKEIVEDYIHDIFLNIYTKDIISPVKEVFPYLVRALHNKLINHLQRQKENIDINNIEFDFSINEEYDSEIFGKSDEDFLLSKRIKDAYNHLSNQQKHILYLRFIMEFNYTQISDIMNITTPSATNLLSRAIIKMRKLLMLLFF